MVCAHKINLNIVLDDIISYKNKHLACRNNDNGLTRVKHAIENVYIAT